MHFSYHMQVCGFFPLFTTVFLLQVFPFPFSLTIVIIYNTNDNAILANKMIPMCMALPKNQAKIPGSDGMKVFTATDPLSQFALC